MDQDFRYQTNSATGQLSRNIGKKAFIVLVEGFKALFKVLQEMFRMLVGK